MVISTGHCVCCGVVVKVGIDASVPAFFYDDDLQRMVKNYSCAMCVDCAGIPISEIEPISNKQYITYITSPSHDRTDLYEGSDKQEAFAPYHREIEEGCHIKTEVWINNILVKTFDQHDVAGFEPWEV